VKRELKDTLIRGLMPAAKGKRIEVWDTKEDGFGIRVTEKGVKSYVLYRRWPPGNVPARRRIGDAGPNGLALATAREIAGNWNRLVNNGKDPREEERKAKLEEQRRRKTTFAAVAEAWFADELKSQRKGAEVERDVRREFVAAWGGRPITDITTLDIRNVIKAKAADAPAQARNLLGYAKRLFYWAVEQQAYGVDQSPAERLRPDKIVGKKVIRQRVLSDAELRAMWRASGGMAYPYGPLYRVLALTGQRLAEVAEARWREFDLDKRLWIIPAARMKMDAPHVVPLADDVIAILDALPKFKNGDHLFSTTFGAKPVSGFTKAKATLDERMRADIGDVPHFVNHDIRRTMRTGLSALVPSDIAELVIGHARPGLRKVYDQHAFEVEKRRALSLWAARLRSIVDPPPAADNVVPMRAAEV
jgi:integrase